MRRRPAVCAVRVVEYDLVGRLLKVVWFYYVGDVYKMVRRRYKSKRRRRRSTSMRRRKRRPRRIPVLMGNQHVCSHKFVDATQLIVDSVGGISVVKTYRANALAQPLPANPSQPNGFQQMVQLFNKHTVIGSKITMTCLPSLG